MRLDQNMIYLIVDLCVTGISLNVQLSAKDVKARSTSAPPNFFSILFG